jgi:hypothetical protein
MRIPAVQFSHCLFQFLSRRSRFSLETSFHIPLFCIPFKRDKFLIHVKQRAWSFMYLTAIIYDAQHKDKIYTMQREMKEYLSLKKPFPFQYITPFPFGASIQSFILSSCSLCGLSKTTEISDS